MANKKNMVRKGKKATKKYKRNYGRILINRLGKRVNDALPEEMYVKLKYTTSRTLTGAPSSAMFRGNDIYQPDDAVFGVQPYNSDQLCPLYQKWQVTGSKIKLTVMNNLQGARICLRPTLNNTPISDLNLEVSRPDSVSRFCATRNKCMLQQYQKTRTVIGNQVDDVSYDGSAGPGGPTAGPNIPWYWGICSTGVDGFSTDVDVQIEIVYYVKLFRRAISAAS